MTSKSGRLRLGEAQALWRLLGECQESGDDCATWRRHWATGLASLVDAEVGLGGEMEVGPSLKMMSLGATYWWRPGCMEIGALGTHIGRFQSTPHYSPAMVAYFQHDPGRPGRCLRRGDFLDDRTWYGSNDFQQIQGPFGLDETLWCFNPLVRGGRPHAETTYLMMLRVAGRRGFSVRDRALVEAGQAWLTPMVGGKLARYEEPAPGQLSPRLRQVLACLLEGEGDKQVARRLGLGEATVNAYTKAVFRHFGVRGRAELLARWIRRGWGGGGLAWSSDPASSSVTGGAGDDAAAAAGFTATFRPAERKAVAIPVSSAGVLAGPGRGA